MDTTGLYVHDLNPSPFGVILGTVGQTVTMALLRAVVSRSAIVVVLLIGG